MSDLQDGQQLRALYSDRFDGDAAFRRAMWKELCEHTFQRYVPADGTVLEIAAGHCEFINSIRARRRIAVDLNPETLQAAAPGVEVLLTSAVALPLDDGSVDTVFTSNFFEHISRQDILSVLVEARRVLRPGGQLVVLQPNVRFCSRDYWMFFDHVTPVDDRALVEAFNITGLETVFVLPRFLPYTTKSRLPSSIRLVKAYLRLPLLWRVLGQQSLLVARRPVEL